MEYKTGMRVKFTVGNMGVNSILQDGLEGTINKDLVIEWDNGMKSLPLTKKNSRIEIIGE